MKSEIKEEILNNFKNTIFEQKVIKENKPLFDKAINNQEISNNIIKLFSEISKEQNDETFHFKKNDYKNHSVRLDFFTKSGYFEVNISKVGSVDFIVNNLILMLNNKGNLKGVIFKKNTLNDYLKEVSFKIDKKNFLSDFIVALKFQIKKDKTIMVGKENNEIKIIVSNVHKELKKDIEHLNFIDKSFLMNNGYIKKEDLEVSHLINDKDVILELMKKPKSQEQQNVIRKK